MAAQVEQHLGCSAFLTTYVDISEDSCRALLRIDRQLPFRFPSHTLSRYCIRYQNRIWHPCVGLKIRFSDLCHCRSDKPSHDERQTNYWITGNHNQFKSNGPALWGVESVYEGHWKFGVMLFHVTELPLCLLSPVSIDTWTQWKWSMLPFRPFFTSTCHSQASCLNRSLKLMPRWIRTTRSMQS